MKLDLLLLRDDHCQRIANLEKDLDIAQRQLLQSDSHMKELEKEDEQLRQAVSRYVGQKAANHCQDVQTGREVDNSCGNINHFLYHHLQHILQLIHHQDRERREISNCLPAGGEVAQGVGVLVSYNSKETVKTLQVRRREEKRGEERRGEERRRGRRENQEMRRMKRGWTEDENERRRKEE
eukprot:762682-Hanusia_phi.AAC.2